MVGGGGESRAGLPIDAAVMIGKGTSSGEISCLGAGVFGGGEWNVMRERWREGKDQKSRGGKVVNLKRVALAGAVPGLLSSQSRFHEILWLVPFHSNQLRAP